MIRLEQAQSQSTRRRRLASVNNDNILIQEKTRLFKWLSEEIAFFLLSLHSCIGNMFKHRALLESLNFFLFPECDHFYLSTSILLCGRARRVQDF
jgi:hypothetical protein